MNAFPGGALWRRAATVPPYAEFDGEDFVVVGGYESGVDVAEDLAEGGARVPMFGRGDPWMSESSDPGVALSPNSLGRLVGLELDRRPRSRLRARLRPPCARRSAGCA